MNITEPIEFEWFRLSAEAQTAQLLLNLQHLAALPFIKTAFLVLKK